MKEDDGRFVGIRELMQTSRGAMLAKCYCCFLTYSITLNKSVLPSNMRRVAS